MTVRVGIIGCGAISAFHLQALAGQPSVEVVACADSSRSGAERCAARFAISQTYTNAREMLKRSDLDAVVICVPPKWHAEYFFEALAEGKHVLIEKPLAVDLAEADRMVGAALASDRIVAVALMHRYLEAYHVLRDLIKAGAVGPIQRVRLSHGRNMYHDSRFRTPEDDPRAWLVDPEIAGGGILMSSSIHFLSAVSFVLGGEVATRVGAKLRRSHPRAFPGIEDDVELQIELADGTEFALHESWVTDQPYGASFVGESGHLTAKGENWWNLTIGGEWRGRLPGTYAARLASGNLLTESPRPAVLPNALFDGLIADFINSIEHGKHVDGMPEIQHARNMQAIIAAAYQSAKTGSVQALHWHDEPSRKLR